MNEEQTPAPEYVAGFNEGYAIGKHLPELAKQLAERLSPSEHNDGFKDGWQELTNERDRLAEQTKTTDQQPKWMQSNRLDALKPNDQREGRSKEDLERD